MAPIKPPSPIFSRRASDSCLPPPCAASAKLAARVSAGTQSVQSTPSTSSLSSSSSSYSGRLSSNARERFSSLPDIREHQGLCIRSSLPSESLASSSSSSSIVPSTSASGSSSPASSSSNRQSSSIEDIEARLQAAISNLSGNSSSNEEDSDGDMYNDTPSCSSSSSALRSSNVRQQEQQSVFEEEDDEDDENGGTTIRIRLASAGDLPKTMSTTRQSKNYNGQFSEDDEENLPFEPCYPLKPLEIDYKPNHRIKRNRSLRRALSDSCTTIALQSHSRQKNDQEDNKGRRKVHFLDSVQVVDVFAAIDYPAR